MIDNQLDCIVSGSIFKTCLFTETLIEQLFKGPWLFN